MDNKPGLVREVIIYGDDFWEFYNKQTQKVKLKINWTIGVVKDMKMVPEQYLKHLEGTDLYEIRINSWQQHLQDILFLRQWEPRCSFKWVSKEDPENSKR